VSRKRVSTAGLIADLFRAHPAVAGDGDGRPSSLSPVPSPVEATARTRDGQLLEIPLDQIHVGPHQARQGFDEERLQELAESIRAHGVIEPVLVTPHPEGSGYLLIAGERRVRAARQAQRTTIPATVRDALSEADILVLSLTENLQREDLSPTERAEGIAALQKATGESLSAVAARLGYTRARVSQLMGYRRLPPAIYEALTQKRITEKQAQAILRVDPVSPAAQRALFEACVEHHLHDAEAGRLARRLMEQPTASPAAVVSGFLEQRRPAESRRVTASHRRLASLTMRLQRQEVVLADLAAQVHHLAKTVHAEERPTAQELQSAHQVVEALESHLKQIEGGLRALRRRG